MCSRNEGVATFTLFSQPYLDKCSQQYKNIVVINLYPQGPLKQWVQPISIPAINTMFKSPSPSPSCGLALTTMNARGDSKWMDASEVPELIGFLVSNSYLVDTQITQMLNSSPATFGGDCNKKLLCIVTYKG